MMKMEDEENQRLIMEYVEPLVGRELLRKFPDNSALDFDYSQSSIWSPLVPRVYIPMDSELITPRKLSYGTKSGLKIKTTSFGINFNVWRKSKKMMKKKNKQGSSDFSPIPPPASAKGWTKMLRAATKHFKKKKDASIHIKLSNCLRDANF